jgi:hypothetical protein
MADKAIDVYQNDHLAGAMLGMISPSRSGTGTRAPLGDVMRSIAPQVEEDRQTLLDLMERMGTSTNPVKQATGWLAEKASRVKFSGIVSGEPDHGASMALESLTLGVEGKASMWKALKEVASEYPPLASANLDELISREAQPGALERERLAAGRRALGGHG